MDLAVTLPLAVLLALQCLVSAGLLLPRAASKHVAGLLAGLNASTGARSALLTVAGAVAAMTLSACVQLVGVVDTLKGQQFGDRALALTVEQLRALLVVAMGTSNLVLLFLCRALAAEQIAGDRAKLNLDVLQRQAKGLQAEYARATGAAASGAAPGGDEAARLRGRVDALIREKGALQETVDEALAAKKGALAQVEAISAQSKGLEREYDRLLSEHDALRRDHAQATGGRLPAGGGGSKKAE
ncbi:hypothetical protein Rsub_00152 [Raphidocelis subcapitata]|uniref:Endoplasmic reticulum transmembrane protein n=1 Tax=Raphidocelis subcapitata TaxID=307507 RepID=A0A2V0NJN3_9CHLO|nr:hypothetical protein Rsub_00152 [Raphidocelis subcapitata]|eukprot:GBF87441.1 hypothetical protein Rsub_00152 [Raphidocelis subcapitata]